MKEKLEKYFRSEYENYINDLEYGRNLTFEEWFRSIQSLDYYKRELELLNK